MMIRLLVNGDRRGERVMEGKLILEISYEFDLAENELVKNCNWISDALEAIEHCDNLAVKCNRREFKKFTVVGRKVRKQCNEN